MKFSNLARELLAPWSSLQRIKRTDHGVTELRARVKWIENYTSGFSDEVAAARRDQLFLTGQIAARQLPDRLDSIQEAEFRVFSQFGEDGIIQYLIRRLSGKLDPSFVEFGVQSYLESNTLFLLMNNGWRGLVIDGEQKYIDLINNSEFCWKYGLKTRCDFISRENINSVFESEGFSSELGLLSIDVDGIDWHLWNALTIVRPGILIIEYNRNFPHDRPITVPYEPLFDRTQKHESRWYYGTSLGALGLLAKSKQYTFVGVERHKRNAFFVRDDLAHLVPCDEIKPDYVDYDTALVMDRLRGMPIFDVTNGKVEPI